MIEIPLTNDTSQVFTITLEGTTYELSVRYNSRWTTWVCSIAQDGVPLIDSIALVGGVDVVNQFTLDLTNLVVVNLDNPSLDPTLEGLGTNSKFIQLTDAEVTGV